MRNLLRFCLITGLLGCQIFTHAQSTTIPFGYPAYHMLDRMEIKSGQLLNEVHTSTRSYFRNATTKGIGIEQWAKSAEANLTSIDKANIKYLLADHPDWGSTNANTQSSKTFLKRFYKDKAALFSVHEPEFNLLINPVLHFSSGSSFESNERLFRNTRGFEIRGNINNKIGFYTFAAENQMQTPLYIRNRIDSTNVLPGLGFLKPFNTKGYDFFLARGYITFAATKNIQLQFGHDRNFIGNGLRSLILSDFSRDYLFLKANTRIWKLNYQNLFTEFVDYRTQNASSESLKRRYAAFHHLSLDVTKNLNIGLFETVIFSRDSNQSQGYELNYLNPLIFYRAIEQGINSTDNVMLGLDLKYNFLKHFSLYGQLLLDEFLLREVRARRGWWGNKYGGQIGLKYIDVANIRNLDMQWEMNTVRPYTYTHFKSTQNYTNFNQPIAHPLGANFREYLYVLRYQPVQKVFVSITGIYAKMGNDTAGSNWGGNILLDYTTREQDFNNDIGQGIATKLYYGQAMVSYMWKHNLFVDLKLNYRETKSDLPQFDSKETFFNVGLRLNIQDRMYAF